MLEAASLAPLDGSSEALPVYRRLAARNEHEVTSMKKILSAATALALALSVSACYSPGDRAAGGAAIGGLTGAAVGAAATGRASGALAGAAIGAAGGAIVGASTAPCPYGTYRDYYGNIYCR
jgi:osmotically inducible lipoprotein OsmB